MRTLLKISVLALVLCAGLMIALPQDVPTSETIAGGAPPPAPGSSPHRSVSARRRGIQTTRLAHGRGIVRTLQSGYLIITSESPNAPVTTIHISNHNSPVANAAPWRALSPLTIASSNKGTGASHPSLRRVTENTKRPERHDDPASTRTFFLHVTKGSLSDPRQYVPVHSRPIAEGQRVRVYLDQQRNLTPRIERSAQQIIDALEDSIMPRANRDIGPWDDVDGDGRLSVLLTPWLEKMQGGKTSLKGFVRGSDFQPRFPAPFGNKADLIYFNSEVAGDVNYLTFLAHEYWHVLQCSYRISLPDAPLAAEEDWINEGTAHLAEIRFGGDSENLAHRIDTWLSAPESAPLVVDNYYSAGLWRDDGCRGATFLFFQWCEQQFGRDLGVRLLTAPSSGARNLELVTGNNLETLQTHWTVAMLEQCRLTDETPRTADGAKLLANIRGFEQVKLDRLNIHSTEHRGKGDTPIEVAPTGTCYLRVEPGAWKIRTEESAEVPLRVTFVSERSTERLARSVTAETDTVR